MRLKKQSLATWGHKMFGRSPCPSQSTNLKHSSHPMSLEKDDPHCTPHVTLTSKNLARLRFRRLSFQSCASRPPPASRLSPLSTSTPPPLKSMQRGFMCSYRGESTHFHLDEMRYIRLRAVRIAPRHYHLDFPTSLNHDIFCQT